MRAEFEPITIQRTTKNRLRQLKAKAKKWIRKGSWDTFLNAVCDEVEEIIQKEAS